MRYSGLSVFPQPYFLSLSTLLISYCIGKLTNTRKNTVSLARTAKVAASMPMNLRRRFGPSNQGPGFQSRPKRLNVLLFFKRTRPFLSPSTEKQSPVISNKKKLKKQIARDIDG